MELKYDKLWFRLAEKGMKKKDLQSLTGLSSATIAKLSHNLSVSTKTLERICQALGCDISDILDSNSTFLHNSQKTNSTFGMNSFFSGIGGFDIGFERQGFKTNYLCDIIGQMLNVVLILTRWKPIRFPTLRFGAEDSHAKIFQWQEVESD